MTYPTTSGGVGTDPRSTDQQTDFQDEIDPRWAAPDSADTGVGIGTLLVAGALAVAAILTVVLFFVVIGSDDAELTTSDTVPASPAGSTDATDASVEIDQAATGQAETDQGEMEQTAPEGFITDDEEESGDPNGGDAAPSALVVTPNDVGSDDSTTTTVASTTTIAPTTTITTTTVASTEPAPTSPPSTEAATTVPPPTETTAAPAPAPGPSGGDAAFQQEVLNLTNAERASAGCGPVVLDPTLNSVADAHSEDMAANNYFDHTGLNGSKPWDRIQAAGYSAGGSGENIAQGYSTAASVMSGWMSSPGHRQNILNCSWTELGVGYAQGHYWTQVFATRR